MPPLLVLFDVDGTLFLTDDQLVAQALRETLTERFGVELPKNPLAGVEHAGQTTLRIGRLVLRNAGLEDGEIDAGLEPWCADLSRRYLELLDSADTGDWVAAPHAGDELARLETAGHRLALLTGNPEPVARARMERLGLARFFPPGQGAFGCESESRSELIDLARARAGDWPREDTVAVGDTAFDRSSAQEAGVRSLLVGRGTSLAGTLAQLG